MKKAELEVAAEMIGEAGDAVEMILSQGIDAAMTKYNRRKTSRSGRAGRKVRTIFAGFAPGVNGKRSSWKSVITICFHCAAGDAEDEIKKVLTVIGAHLREKGGKIEKTSTGARGSWPIAWRAPRRHLTFTGNPARTTAN